MWRRFSKVQVFGWVLRWWKSTAIKTTKATDESWMRARSQTFNWKLKKLQGCGLQPFFCPVWGMRANQMLQMVWQVMRCFPVMSPRTPDVHTSLWRFHQVVDVDEKVVVKLYKVDRGLGLHLVDDHACSFPTVLFGVLHLFPHQAVHHLARFPLRRDTVVYGGGQGAQSQPLLLRVSSTALNPSLRRQRRSFRSWMSSGRPPEHHNPPAPPTTDVVHSSLSSGTILILPRPPIPL